MNKLLSARLGILSSFLMLGAVCSAQEEKLPEKAPELHRLEFAGPEEGWPPHPKRRTNVQQVQSKEIAGSLTDTHEAAIHQAALSDPGVRRLLGDRFAYVSADEIEPAKGKIRQPDEPVAVRVTFYSHTNNVAVEVQMIGTRVRSVRKREGYQPPAGTEEIAAATRYAHGDDRLRDKISGLNSFAIVTATSEKDPAFGHRILYVTFSRKKDEDMPAIYFAYVDLTDQKVLDAGSLQKK